MTQTAAERALINGADYLPARQAWSHRPSLVVVPPGVDRAGSDRWRRSFNVMVAAVTLLLVWPLMLLIALAVKLTSPGPVIYRQQRVGVDRRRPGSRYTGRRGFDHGGRLFTMYKFRTMHGAGAPTEQWASPQDARVTAVGKLLRRYRLDELPQLVNVLRGDMNLVGPRPEQPTIFASLRAQVDQYQLRQRTLPGITGWAQVNQSYDTCIADVRRKVHLDMEYLGRASAREDMKILLLTVPVVLLKKGAW